MDNEISQSFPDVSNFMAQTYMDEQELQGARSADAQPGNGGNVEGMLQTLEDRVSLLSTDFSSIIENVTKSLDSILIGSRDTLDQVSSLLEDQRKESQDRENLLEEKFLLADKQGSSISIVEPLLEIMRSVEELGLDIIKIKPEDADGGLLDAIKSMPKWVIGTLIAMGVVTAAQLGYPESDSAAGVESIGGDGSMGDVGTEENLEPGKGNGGNLSVPGDPDAGVINKSLGTNYGTFKKVGGTISWRNNNPGNIVFEKGGFAEKMGAIGYTMGTKNHRIAVFPTMEMGNKAKKTLLFGPKFNYINMSIRKMVERYAPRASGNNTDAYVAAITKALGVPETTILSSLSEAQRDTFLQTIIKVEGFREGVVRPLKSKVEQVEKEESPASPQNAMLDAPLPKNKNNTQAAQKPPVEEKQNKTGERIADVSKEARQSKINSTKNMVNVINGGGKQKPSNVQQAPQLIPAINLNNSMVA